ncbi:MAG: biosynthetic-type acetolactate synthase large subunit, partial [Sphingomonas sp.]
DGVDTLGLTRSCVKHNFALTNPEALEAALKKAFFLARSGRPGPVLVEVAAAALRAPIQRPFAYPRDIPIRAYRSTWPIARGQLRSAIEALRQAERPLIYYGGGVVLSNAHRELRALAELTGAPVTSTLMGLGAFDGTHPHFLGMLGMHGTYEANMAMQHCDVLLAVGARFDDRVTGRLDAFSPNSRKVHVDIDRSSINKNVRVDLPIIADVGSALADMIALWKSRQHPKPELAEWFRRIEGWRARRCLDFAERQDVIMPQQAIRSLYEATKHLSPIITTEVGQHQMWAAQHFHFEEPNKWLTSGGLGTMGYGLPAAIGAQLGEPGRLVIDIAGEASIQMNIQELATATQYRLPVKIFILNNEYMGMVRQWQELTYQSRYSESYSDALPDFVKLGEAYGWKGIRIDTRDQLDGGIADMLAYDGPVIVDCRVAKLANCFPMIPSGAAHTEMILEGNEVSGEMDDEAKALV